MFFQAEIEKSKSTVWQEVANERVRVGINLDGIHIISEKHNSVKLSLPYDKLRYNSWEDPEDGDACFLVEFDVADAPEFAIKPSKKNPTPPSKHSIVLWTRQV